MNCFAARQEAPLIARCNNGKDSLHGAEKKTLLLGQLYVGLDSLSAAFVTIIAQLMYCLVLCSCFAGMNKINKQSPTKHSPTSFVVFSVYIQ
jgi:hypothetical protein